MKHEFTGPPRRCEHAALSVWTPSPAAGLYRLLDPVHSARPCVPPPEPATTSFSPGSRATGQMGLWTLLQDCPQHPCFKPSSSVFILHIRGAHARWPAGHIPHPRGSKPLFELSSQALAAPRPQARRTETALCKHAWSYSVAREHVRHLRVIPLYPNGQQTALRCGNSPGSRSKLDDTEGVGPRHPWVAGSELCSSSAPPLAL